MIGYLKTRTPGVELFYRMDDVKKPKANIIINHGFAEHLGRYDYVSKRLVEAGYNVLRYDLRGHGQSKGPKGHIDSYEKFIEDADAMLALMQISNPGLENYMMGHSMGGLITTLHGLRYPTKVKGQILSGAANGKLPEASTLKAKALALLSKVSPKVQIKNPVEEAICSDPLVVSNYLKDPLVLKSASINFYNEFLNKATDEVLLDLDNYNLPVLILHGAEDKIVPKEISENFYKTARSEDKRLIVYPELFHEILNEGEKTDIMDTIIQWLDAGQMTSDQSI